MSSGVLWAVSWPTYTNMPMLALNCISGMHTLSGSLGQAAGGWVGSPCHPPPTN